MEPKDVPSSYRFLPTQQELMQYLADRVHRRPISDNVIKEVKADALYSKHPRALVKEMLGKTGAEEREWYFFIHGDEYFDGKTIKVQPVGDATGSWKSFGRELPIYKDDNDLLGMIQVYKHDDDPLGFKFHSTYYSDSLGLSKKTHWQMMKYRLQLAESSVANQSEKKYVAGKIMRGRDYTRSL